MAQQLQDIINLARSYQLPNWHYNIHQNCNPYLLSSLGYKPLTPSVIQCHICLKTISLVKVEELSKEEWITKLKNHQEDCIYSNEQSHVITKQELYLALEDIISQMNLTNVSQLYPVLDTEAIVEFVESNAFIFKKILMLYDMEIAKYQIKFMLQMFGWYFTKNSKQQPSLACYFCGRVVPISRFATTSSERQQPSTTQNLSIQRISLFNPIDQHRYFCLWTNTQQFWTLYLQHYEDKFSQYSSFKYKTKPLETQRMRYNIDKYLQTTKEKIEAGLQKLKGVTLLCGKLTQSIGRQNTEEQALADVKRVRDYQKELEMREQSVSGLMQPLKKIKLT